MPDKYYCNKRLHAKLCSIKYNVCILLYFLKCECSWDVSAVASVLKVNSSTLHTGPIYCIDYCFKTI